jgi:PAS domain S-box-containing protein
LKTIPFIVYTATYTDPKDEQLALEMGANDFILKPTEPEPFLARINGVMTKAKHGEPSPLHAPNLENTCLNKEYDEVLIRKLEEKAVQFEESNRALQKDIAERNRVEQAFVQSEDHLRSVVQTTGDAILTLDEKGKVQLWNNAAETMFGFAPAEMIGEPMVRILPVRFQGEFQMRPKRPVVTGQLVLGQHPIEVFGLRKDGGEFPAEITVSTWKAKEGTFFTAIVRDITERKHAEEEMRKRVRELEGMNHISTILRTASNLEKMLPSLLEEPLAMVESATGASGIIHPEKGFFLPSENHLDV